MKIKSVKFMKGIVGDDEMLNNGVPQIAFIGRSNVGKSSLINLLTNTSISKTSSFPGRTQEINVFLINESFYFMDLPGYGFARLAGLGREKIGNLIKNYLFGIVPNQKMIVMIVDANVGMTDKDISMLEELEFNRKNFIIVANKIDKLNQSDFHKKMKEIEAVARGHHVIPFSTKTKKGVDMLLGEILQ